jgi:protein-disulfide isomerase
MTMRLGLASVAMLSLMVAGCGDDQNNATVAAPDRKVEAVAPPAGKEWTQVVSETAEGGFVMGNPQAPVKLIEYGSFGCSHCAQFEATGYGPLEELVKSGRLSWEFRSYLIFPSDPAVSLLTRCHGPDAYFLLTQQLYATQAEWLTKLQQAAAQIEPLPPEQRLGAIVKATGLDAFFRQRGMPQAKIDACLADKAALERVLEIHKIGNEKYQVGGTPTFFINGVKVMGDSWASLEPSIKQALGE